MIRKKFLVKNCDKLGKYIIDILAQYDEVKIL